MSLATGHVITNDGVRLHYHEAGVGKAVVLIHGGGLKQHLVGTEPGRSQPPVPRNRARHSRLRPLATDTLGPPHRPIRCGRTRDHIFTRAI